MIESTKFNKMLHILKRNSDDLNINICIIDYDISKECDYEVITLHLKETNTQNGAYVYKDLVIRSQLYYDEDDDKYYSALDGNIINKEKALAEINILTEIDKSTFEDENVSLMINLLDAETQEPLKNQIVYLYVNGASDESILFEKTNKYGEALFSLHLPTLNITSGEHILYFEYKGNKTYRKVISDYIFINLEDMKNKYIESDITAYIEADESLILTYTSTFNNKSWPEGFKEYSDLDVDENDLTNGEVSFYIVKDNTRVFLGGGLLSNTRNETYSAILTKFPKIYYNQDINIEAEFEGNNYFSPNIASTSIRFNRVNPTNIELIVVDGNDNPIDVVDDDEGFRTKLSFEVNDFALDSDLYESGLNDLYKLFGQVTFYLQNSNGEWGTLGAHLPFYISSNLVFTEENDIYTISTETDWLGVNLSRYGLAEGDPLRIKAEYSGNAIINDFSISNVSQAPRGKSER